MSDRLTDYREFRFRHGDFSGAENAAARARIMEAAGVRITWVPNRDFPGTVLPTIAPPYEAFEGATCDEWVIRQGPSPAEVRQNREVR